MKFFDSILLSLRMFRARPLRTVLTILGMGMGIAAVLFLVSLGFGLQEQILNRITSSKSLSVVDILGGVEGTGISGALIDEVGKIDGVEHVSPVYIFSTQIQQGGIVVDASGIFSDIAYIDSQGLRIVAGSLPTEDNSNSVVLSSAILTVLDISSEEIIGSEVNINVLLPEGNVQRSLIVSGISDGENGVVYASSNTFTEMKEFSYKQARVVCDSVQSVNRVRGDIVALGLVASSVSETVDQVNAVFRVITIVLILFGLCALGISGIGMFNTMTVALLERTEEIGILKSIGASDRTVANMFIFEASIMGFLGGVVGVALGFFGQWAANALVGVVLLYFGGNPTDLFSTPLWFVTLTLVLGVLAGYLTSVFPAKRAGRIDPLEALRYK